MQRPGGSGASAMTVYDAIVVGSGAAGSWAAKMLGEGRASVLILEAGRPIDPETDFPVPPRRDWGRLSRIAARAQRSQHVQAHCLSFFRRTRRFYVDDGDNPYTTASRKPFLWFRGRQTGGRLHTWYRSALRMSPDDFHPSRRAIADADWPIEYEDLAPYYDRVGALSRRFRSAGVPAPTPGRSLLRFPAALAGRAALHRASERPTGKGSIPWPIAPSDSTPTAFRHRCAPRSRRDA